MPKLINAVCVAAVFFTPHAFALRLHHHGVISQVSEGLHKKPDSETVSININTALIKDLLKIPGLGPKKAEAIVNYRKEHGVFHAIADLQHVPGIGKSRLEAWATLPKTSPHPSVR